MYRIPQKIFQSDCNNKNNIPVKEKSGVYKLSCVSVATRLEVLLPELKNITHHFYFMYKIQINHFRKLDPKIPCECNIRVLHIHLKSPKLNIPEAIEVYKYNNETTVKLLKEHNKLRNSHLFYMLLIKYLHPYFNLNTYVCIWYM